MAAPLRSQVTSTYRCCCSTLSRAYLASQPTSSAQTQRSFSTTPGPPMPRSRTPRRLPRDRGASALRRKTYPYMMSVGREELPEPVMDPDLKTELTTSEDHPLWAFFNPQKTVLSTPVEDHKHGRAWTVDELRRKSWEDLHKLWWVCVRERNLMATQELERRRIKPGYGDKEAYSKEIAVKTTQRGIKHALTERYYAWQEALKVAEKDPEVNLNGRGAVYSPKVFEVCPYTGYHFAKRFAELGVG